MRAPRGDQQTRRLPLPVRNFPFLVAVAASCVVFGGCATDSATRSSEQSPPEVRAVEAAHGEVVAAAEEGFDASEQRDAYRVRTRFNPPRCKAPTFEVYIHGRWTRVWLDGKGDIDESIQTYREQVDGISAEPFEIRGRVSGKREAETEISYPVFWVTEFEPNL